MVKRDALRMYTVQLQALHGGSNRTAGLAERVFQSSNGKAPSPSHALVATFYVTEHL